MTTVKMPPCLKHQKVVDYHHKRKLNEYFFLVSDNCNVDVAWFTVVSFGLGFTDMGKGYIRFFIDVN